MNPTSYGKVTQVEWIGDWGDPQPFGCGIKRTATGDGAKVHIHRDGCPDLILTFDTGGSVTHIGTIAFVDGGS